MKPCCRFYVVALFSLLALGARCACAQVTVYGDPANFDANTTGNSNYTFATSGSGNESEGTSYTDGPLTFGGPELFLDDDGGYGSGVSYLSDNNNGPETISLSGATALSFNLGTYDGAETINISVNGVATTTLTETAGQPNTAFIGFTDTVPITSLTFTNATAGDEIDVISFQVGAAVPEPSTWASLSLGGVGLLGLTLRGRKMRRDATLI